MAATSLYHSIVKIYETMSGKQPDENIGETINLLMADNGIGQYCPHWFNELFESVAQSKNFENRNITFECFFKNNIDINNFLAELCEEIAIPRVNEGEYSVISFDKLGVSICFDFEARSGGVDIRYMRWPPETGTHFDRRQTLD